MSAALSIESLKSQAEGLSFRNQAFIGGDFVAAASGQTFDCVSPLDGRVLTQVAAGDAEDIDRAVKAARAAFEDGRWSRMHPAKRKKVLLRWADLIEEHKTELALLETLDMGKPIGDASGIDIPAVANCIRWYGEAIDKIYDEVAPTGPDAVAMMLREPLGVIGAVVPWNFPLLMAAWKMGPALATGNSMVIKPAEQSPLTALRAAELAIEAGLPEGVLERGAGLRRNRGPGPRPPYGRRRRRLYRFRRGRQALHEVLRRVQHEAGLAGVRRQDPEHRHGRCPGSRRRGDGGGLGDLLQPG